VTVSATWLARVSAKGGVRLVCGSICGFPTSREDHQS
jgi:hypothetical protein